MSTTKLYRVTRPNINFHGNYKEIGDILELTEAQASALVNKVEIAPTAASYKAEAKRLAEAAEEMAKKAKAAVSKAVSGKGSKGDKEASK